MRRRLSDSLQQSQTSHGHQPDYPNAETSLANSLSVSKVLKSERTEMRQTNDYRDS